MITSLERYDICVIQMFQRKINSYYMIENHCQIILIAEKRLHIGKTKAQ